MIWRLRRGRLDALRQIYDRYLLACLVNRIRSLHRGDRRPNTMGPGLSMESPSTGSPERWVVMNEQMRRIAAALAQLPTEPRGVVTLHVDVRLGFREIARMQNAPVDTISAGVPATREETPLRK